LSSAKDKSDITQLLLLIAAAQSLLEKMPAVVSSSLADALADMHGEVYSTLRSTATGRSTPDASWIRLKTVTSEAKQDMFQQLLFRVGAISIMGPQQPYALTSASHASGAAVEAVAILLCLRAYLDEQGQPLLLPDDCDVAQLTHPAPVIEFIRALLNLAFFNFPVLELAAPAASGRLSPADASGDGGGGSAAASRNSMAVTGKRGSVIGASLALPTASPITSTPILTFFASSMSRSLHGMFADGAGGSRCAALCSSVCVCFRFVRRDACDSVARKAESLALLHASMMQVLK
jgi:hypothetical protein